MKHSSPTLPPPAWLFIAPLALFLVLGVLNPEIPELSLTANPDNDPAIARMNQVTLDASQAASYRYLMVVTVQVLVVGGLLIFVGRRLLQHFPWRISFWGPLVGGVGVVVWVGICELHLERQLLEALGWSMRLPERVGFDPWQRMPDESWRTFFLVLRFSLLSLVVPLAEELFLRGWFGRWIQDNDQWPAIGLSDLGRSGQLAIIGYAVLAHPGEILAAIAWFGLVNLLMVRSGRFWDCVIAHATTNFLLGCYVIVWSRWYLW